MEIGCTEKILTFRWCLHYCLMGKAGAVAAEPMLLTLRLLMGALWATRQSRLLAYKGVGD